MTRTLEEARAYGRGYNTGSKGAWPLHKPPRPPDEVVGNLLEALKDLRDGVDGQIAMFGEDDPFTLILGPLVDKADEAMESLGMWIVTPAGPEE